MRAHCTQGTMRAMGAPMEVSTSTPLCAQAPKTVAEPFPHLHVRPPLSSLQRNTDWKIELKEGRVRGRGVRIHWSRWPWPQRAARVYSRQSPTETVGWQLVAGHHTALWGRADDSEDKKSMACSGLVTEGVTCRSHTGRLCHHRLPGRPERTATGLINTADGPATRCRPAFGRCNTCSPSEPVPRSLDGWLCETRVCLPRFLSTSLVCSPDMSPPA